MRRAPLYAGAGCLGPGLLADSHLALGRGDVKARPEVAIAEGQMDRTFLEELDVEVNPTAGVGSALGRGMTAKRSRARGDTPSLGRGDRNAPGKTKREIAHRKLVLIPQTGGPVL